MKRVNIFLFAIALVVLSGCTTAEKTVNKDKMGSYEDQIKVIASCYDEWNSKFRDEFEVLDRAAIAISDFNHNGRLELIISDCQGSGAYSYTYFFEVNKDYNGIEQLPVNGVLEMDIIGDFVNCSSYSCYKSEDRYYYLVEDYTSAGWSMKGTEFYAYSFDKGVESSLIASYVFSSEVIDSEAKDDVYYYDKNHNLLADKEAFEAELDNWHEEFEKQPEYTVKWVEYPESSDCMDALRSSLDA